MIENSKNPSNNCKFCGWEFHQEILQRIIDNTQPVLCEFCGIELNISNVNIREDLNKPRSDLIANHDKEVRNKKLASFKNLKKWISPQKYSVSVIEEDDEFPKIFKDNLIIVISRIIYLAIRNWEQEKNISIRRVSLEKSIQIYIIEKIKPILNKRVPYYFLNSLCKIKKEDFEEWLRLSQKKMALNKEYKTSFKFYLNWLIKTVFKIVSDMWDMKNLPRFYATILNDLKTYDFNEKAYPLDSIIESNISGKKQTLYENDEEKIKECGRCHQILPYKRFYTVSKNTSKVRPYCKKCHSELALIRKNKKKLKLILNDFKGKCSKCEIDIILLPALQFHHEDPHEKTYSWRDVCGRSYQFLSNMFRKENTILLCSNCHLNEQATNLRKYYRLIFQKNLFQLSPEEINNQILEHTSKIPNKLNRTHIREKIREWIKKRFVIEQLYNGKCIGCGNSDLVSLEFHHINPNIEKKLKWESLECHDTKVIIEHLMDQNCICLCSNCHSLIHSRYYEFAEEILETFFNNDLLVQKVKLIKKHYEILLNNISNFKIEKKKIELKPLLSLEIPHNEIWKIHLLEIYYYLKKSNKNLIKAYDLNPILKISIRHIYKHLNKFIEQKYIEKDPKTRGRYRFTIFGLYKIKEIEKNHHEKSLEIQKQFLNL